MTIRNVVKEAAASRRTIRGVHMTFAAPAAIEVLANADIEFVYLDGEHGCFDWRDIETGCITAERHALTLIARVPDTSTATITRFLDRGVRGIVAPHVESLDDARQVIECTYFGPLGTRSFGAGRPEYGQRMGSKTEYMQACNAAISICLMIESAKGLALAGDFAALPGVDYLSFGMLDLAQSLGHPGDSGHSRREAGGGGGERADPQGGQAGARRLHEVRVDQRRAEVAGARATLRSMKEDAMIENQVLVPTKYGVQPCFAACPDAPGQFPAVIIYMDAPGTREELRDHARHVAKHGYFCLLPDLYYRLGSIRFDIPRRNEAMSG